MPARGRATTIDQLRADVARLERHAPLPSAATVLPFGVAALDAVLPGGGLPRGALHETVGAGSDVGHGTAAALLVAGILARAGGPVLWVSVRFDLFAPALAGVGLAAGRVTHVEAGRDVLAAMEEGLRHPGLAGVVGEITGRLALTPSRRLQLAAASTGALAFAIRRPARPDDPALAEPNAAATRWRVAPLPSAPPLPHAPEVPGLGRGRWRLDLLRVRGGVPSSWIVEAPDAQGHLALAADLADGSAGAAPAWRAAG
ncbi:ImuA family protein [Roseicella aquatilis]|uniref:Damage-inducible protein n=1 Tax=Roseicella aquatilis TaxID=2527868 RepID=A0A4R4DK57_9PROT|nr:damage-inducible protein [Roseicella aquatilis]TCZ61115.1 damage-inducible protein [Roseicella aquatilis]